MRGFDAGESTREALDDNAGVGRLTLEYLRMQLTLVYRYRINFFGQLVASYLFFVIVFLGGTSAMEQLGQTSNLGSGVDAFVAGWFLVVMVHTAYSSLASGIKTESRLGTLEQLYITPYGFTTLMLSRIAIQILMSILSGFVLLALMLLTTRRLIAIDILTIVPIVVLTLLSVIGIGLLLAGLTLVYKNVSSLISIVQLVVVGLVAAPLVNVPALRYLPVAQGSSMLQRAMTESTSLWHFPIGDLLILCLVSIGYFTAGYVTFQYCLRVARSRGVMGHY